MGQALRNAVSETAVHFGADAACAGAHGLISGPQVFVRKLFGQVFGNGQVSPHRQVTVHQQRHLAGGREVLQGGLEL